ncbi:MAG: putative transrane protein of unknown function [Firmicutes bacterium]|nr:putative transrane protein of unknown function [Bacillota bacterium]
MENFPHSASYFLAESEASARGFLTAVIAIALSVYFIFVLKKPFWEGLGYTLLLVAFLIGPPSAYVFLRTDGQVAALSEQYQNDPQSVLNQEAVRMSAVIDRYRYIRIVQVVAINAGLLLLLFPSKQSLYKGIAVGLIWFAVSNFITEYYSEARAILYLQQLHK